MSWRESFSMHQPQNYSCQSVQLCPAAMGVAAQEALTRTERFPSEDQCCRCQGLEPHYQGSASGAESGVYRCSSSHPSRRTNQPCNLRRDTETWKIFLVLSYSCASCEKQRPEKSAFSDFSCWASSTKKPLTRRSHSWGLIVLLIGKHGPWHDFLPHNIQARLGNKRARSCLQGSVWEHCIWGLGRRGQPHREQAGSCPVPSEPWLGLGLLYSQPRGGGSL